jgi:L-lactate dehydrogenase (cytochrome)
LYVLKDKNRTKSLLQEVTYKGVKAIFVTVDLPVISKREVDIRIKQIKAGKILPFERSSGIDPSLYCLGPETNAPSHHFERHSVSG